jgi:hypothetical protein
MARKKNTESSTTENPTPDNQKKEKVKLNDKIEGLKTAAQSDSKLASILPLLADKVDEYEASRQTAKLAKRKLVRFVDSLLEG